jgi:hypothetical protein
MTRPNQPQIPKYEPESIQKLTAALSRIHPADVLSILNALDESAAHEGTKNLIALYWSGDFNSFIKAFAWTFTEVYSSFVVLRETGSKQQWLELTKTTTEFERIAAALGIDTDDRRFLNGEPPAEVEVSLDPVRAFLAGPYVADIIGVLASCRPGITRLEAMRLIDNEMPTVLFAIERDSDKEINEKIPSVLTSAFDRCAEFDNRLKAILQHAQHTMASVLESLISLTGHCAGVISQQQQGSATAIGEKLRTAIAMIK